MTKREQDTSVHHNDDRRPQALSIKYNQIHVKKAHLVLKPPKPKALHKSADSDLCPPLLCEEPKDKLKGDVGAIIFDG